MTDYFVQSLTMICLMRLFPNTFLATMLLTSHKSIRVLGVYDS